MAHNVKFNQLEKAISLTLKTKSPEKYILLDRETGNTFVGNENGEWQLISEGPHRHE
jgi:hypothetical protein